MTTDETTIELTSTPRNEWIEKSTLIPITENWTYPITSDVMTTNPRIRESTIPITTYPRTFDPKTEYSTFLSILR